MDLRLYSDLCGHCMMYRHICRQNIHTHEISFQGLERRLSSWEHLLHFQRIGAQFLGPLLTFLNTRNTWGVHTCAQETHNIKRKGLNKAHYLSIYFVCIERDTCMPGCMGSSEDTCGNWSFPSTIWVLGTELRRSGLAASTFAPWAILPPAVITDVLFCLSVSVRQVCLHNPGGPWTCIASQVLECELPCAAWELMFMWPTVLKWEVCGVGTSWELVSYLRDLIKC